MMKSDNHRRYYCNWSFLGLVILATLSLDSNIHPYKVSAFIGPNNNISIQSRHSQQQQLLKEEGTNVAFLPKKISSSATRSSSLGMMEDNGMMMMSSMMNSPFWLATVSADIDNIPSNEFTTVFAGGIMVMFGGVVSALIVGLILESGDSYASVVADSYEDQKEEMIRNIQEEDEEFWSKLSPEEQEQAKQILITLKEKKMEREGKKVPVATTSVQKDNSVTPTTTSSSKGNNMFSDYDD
eukprot:CAMPEP_0197837236 /NCGR_PEP_ID=MMETSP1437-20131217/31528_1 /TAXON_ID=49252 ORGANISM="Eucampia antarctica, Strain CCMP1452" /NCGR_SAMPLE_ID=MMETSP1437 /ASSEMBLY_ACC=CAM_ASM_001096 /LENGTH=239 /DNA_ID=CAMNT_0043444113 /DNA_START=74 /DNA_END=793 /DNA_ORIENTATION=-